MARTPFFLVEGMFYSRCLNGRLTMQTSAAETVALKALAHIAADADILLRFLTISGLGAADLRRRAGEPELLAAVLDFVLSDDAITRSFAVTEGVTAETLHAARRALPGGTAESY